MGCSVLGDVLPAGVSLEVELVGVVHEAVQNRVSDGGVGDPVVPLLDGQLAGDHGRAAAVAVLDDLEQIMALRSCEVAQPEVVEDQHVRPLQLRQDFSCM